MKTETYVTKSNVNDGNPNVNGGPRVLTITHIEAVDGPKVRMRVQGQRSAHTHAPLVTLSDVIISKADFDVFEPVLIAEFDKLR